MRQIVRGIRLTETADEMLKKMARDEHRSLSGIVKVALLEYAVSTRDSNFSAALERELFPGGRS